jgi:amino acid adenylation domain-containing protein
MADLTFAVDQVEPSVTGTLRFRRGLFDEASARRILGQLHTLLGCALADPGLPVAALPMDRPGQLQATVSAADQIASADPVEHPVHELVRLRARARPAAIALACDGEELTYQQLEEQSALITTALAATGGVAGRPVAVRVASDPSRIAAVLGVLGAGAHLVCLGSGDLGERGRMVLAEIRPACLVLDGDPDQDDVARWYTSELNGRILDVRALGSSAVTPAPVSGDVHATAYVAYTSGSTGKPKGIIHSHRNLAQFATWLAAEFGLRAGSRVAQWAAPGYDASLCEIFAALVSGATLCPVPERIRANPEKMLDWLIAGRITLFQTVPSFARELLKAIMRRDAGRQLTALDHLLLAGEALPASLADDLRTVLPGVRLVNLYGATETILATWYDVTGAVSGTVPVGRSIPGRQVLVLDELDQPCPAGVTGQIVVRSPYVTLGYVGAGGHPEHTFRPLPSLGPPGSSRYNCYLTGDLGRLRWDGQLEFCGRQDEQVKFNGTRIELSDIEAALAAHESIAECIVVAVANADGLVTRLVGYVVPRRGDDGRLLGSAALWRASLRRRFGHSMPPVSFKTLARLPRNLGGKVDRRLLLADPVAAPVARAAETRAERVTAAIWTHVLGGDPPHADDSFFAAGGNSMLLLILLNSVREYFGADIPLWEFCANPTLARLAELAEPQYAMHSRIK